MDIETVKWEKLMYDAAATAQVYMQECTKHIDEEFGYGHAKKNPELLIGMIKASSDDFKSSVIKLSAQDIRDGLY